MPIITSKMLQAIKFSTWPLPLRKPLCLWFIKRKKLESLPFKTRLNEYIFEGDAANLIDYHVLSRGAFEPGLTELLKIWGKAIDNSLILDVGANVGVHSLGVCRAYKEVLSVEPFPPLIERLIHHIDINKIQNIKLIRGGLAAADSEANFIPPEPGNLGTGRVAKVVSSKNGSDELRIQLFSGDNLINKQARSLAAIKIDVEGHELDVLSGLRNSINNYRPLIVCELLTSADAHISKFKSLLPESYHFYSLNNIKRKKFTLSKWDGGAGDIVACPSEKIDLINGYIIN